MSGGVSHVDSFDPKPLLKDMHGKDMPVDILRTQFDNNGKIMQSPWKAKKYGQSGLEMTNLFPHIADCADDIALVRSMTADFSEHAQGNFYMHTGFPFLGVPSAGATTKPAFPTGANRFSAVVSCLPPTVPRFLIWIRKKWSVVCSRVAR